MNRIILTLGIIFILFSSKGQENKMEYGPLKIPFQSITTIRNDSLFVVYFYPTKENADSVKINFYGTRFGKKYWITNKAADGSFSVIKLSKKRPFKLFISVDGSVFQTDNESITQKYWNFVSEEYMIVYRRFGRTAYSKIVEDKDKIIKTKKRLKLLTD